MPARPEQIAYDGHAGLPESVSIETTRFCNLRCRMCEFVHLGSVATGPHMDPVLLEKFSEEILPLIDRVQPTVSGEPLMTRNLPALLARAAHYGVRLDIITNGMLLDERMLDRLMPVLGNLCISFDAPTKETFEAIRTGSKFEKIVANVRRSCERARELPDAERPVISLAATLMRRNIEELPDLVDFAVELGIDKITCHHVHPFDDATKQECLVHHRALAMDCIDRAARRAEELGIAFRVDALGLIGAETATGSSGARQEVTDHGVVAGLEERSVNENLCRPWPSLDQDDPKHAEIVARRDAARMAANGPPMSVAAGSAASEESRGHPESIWTCTHLWTRTMIGLNGDVRPCCVPGVPVLGNLQQESFVGIWNGPAYRQMRARMVVKEPEPTCRGCQWIKEIKDPAEIAQHLRGMALPARGDVSQHQLAAVGTRCEVTAPVVDKSLAAPRLDWVPVAGCRKYELELSLDDFVTVEFCSTWHEAPFGDASYQIPQWVWEMAPKGKPVTWRAIAYLDGSRIVAESGQVLRSEGAEREAHSAAD